MADIILKMKFSDGEVNWKTDSFWSLTKNREHAKIHPNDTKDRERLYKNLLYILNSDLNDKDKIKEAYNNVMIGYDIVKSIDIVNFDFIKNGIYEYKIKYNGDKFELIDIIRKQKLDKLSEIL